MQVLGGLAEGLQKVQSFDPAHELSFPGTQAAPQRLGTHTLFTHDPHPLNCPPQSESRTQGPLQTEVQTPPEQKVQLPLPAQSAWKAHAELQPPEAQTPTWQNLQGLLTEALHWFDPVHTPPQAAAQNPPTQVVQ